METTQLLNPNLQMQWDYDPEADVLYMSVGEPQPALGVDIGEGLVLRYRRNAIRHCGPHRYRPKVTIRTNTEGHANGDQHSSIR